MSILETTPATHRVDERTLNEVDEAAALFRATFAEGKAPSVDEMITALDALVFAAGVAATGCYLKSVRAYLDDAREVLLTVGVQKALLVTSYATEQAAKEAQRAAT